MMTKRQLAVIALGAALCLTAHAHRLAAQGGPPAQGQGSPPAAFQASAANPEALRSALAGGVPSGESPQGPIRLTLAEAIARGLDHNLAAVLAGENVRAAGGARTAALSGVLPAFEAGLAASRQKISLEEYGFPVAPGESPLLGPFNVVLGDISLSQALFDVSAMARARAGGERLTAARFSLQDTRDLVVVACAGLYLQAVTATSRVEAARAQLATAEALARRAQDMKQAGTIPGVEVLRAEVQLASQRQRLIQAENELARLRLALARAIGLPLAQEFDLVDRVPYAELSAMSVDEALAQAHAARPDLKGAEAMLRAAEDEQRAAVGQAWPSLHLNADVAKIGPTAEDAKGVYSIAAAVRIPLFEGGRVQGQITQSRAAAEQQRARLADLKARIEYEVRTALLDLRAAAEQVEVASGARDLAKQQLAQTEDRFTAGVIGNIEVVQAQQALAEATENYISSLLAHNVAKLALAHALGTAEARAGQYLGGGE